MFSLFNGIYDSYLAPSQLNLLIVGAQDSGKTTFLERLKVTEIPTRPRRGGGGNKTVQQRLGAEEPTSTLRDALVETGALKDRRRTFSMTSFGENSFNNTNISIDKQLSGRSVMSTSMIEASAKTISTTTTATHAPPSSTSSSSNHNNKNVRTSTGNALVVTEKKRRFSICPAPERYMKSVNDQDEDFIMEGTNDDVLGEETEQLLSRNNDNIDNNRTTLEQSILREDSFSSNHTTSDPPQRVRCHSKEFDVNSFDLIDGERSSMQNILFDHSDQTTAASTSVPHDELIRQQQYQSQQLSTSSALPEQQQIHVQQSFGPPLLQTTTKEYDLKSKSKMLPLRMVRPTIGTNLAKISMYACQCHIFDVGGRLHDLWERYYDDCDAVIFCWKLGDDPDKPPHQRDNNDDSDDEEEDSSCNIYKEQLEMLNQVRNSIPDDVPFLIIGHIFGNANVDIVDRMYTTDILLPRYHNPMTGFCCGSAKTGAGIQSSMEWLIPLAKRQQKERMASRKQLLEGGKEL